MKPPDAKLHELVRQLTDLQRRSKALGVFTNDRELLECPRCGLLEDVTCAGLLITCRADALGEDTGLRFVPLADNLFRCPSCAQRVEATVDELEKTRKQLGSRK
jgi:uncharacterized C2H2 Zn-finger protein